MYDLIIIGGGPAGVSAAVYAARYKLNFLLISESLGGWLNEIDKIENYPGFSSISGFELVEKYREQLNFLNVNFISKSIISIKKEENIFTVCTKTDNEYKTKSIIIASGSKKKTLGVSGEKELLGKGVSYCAICDGMFYKDKTVAVVGGANSAANATLLLAKFANSVYLIYRKGALRADNITIEKIKENPKIKIILNTNITKINGEEKVKSANLDTEYEKKNILPLDGVFIEIGLAPVINMIENIGINLDDKNQIQVDGKCRTNIGGIFSAGDVTNGHGQLKQIVTALSSGAIASSSVNDYLKTN